MSKADDRVLQELASFTDELYVRFRVALGLKHSKLIREGVQRARERGRRLGRPPAISPVDHYLVYDLSLSSREVARRLGVSPETVNRMRRAPAQLREVKSA